MTPTQRTLKLLREQGYLAGVVERWIPGARKRADLFGFIDIIAISGSATVGVQSTGTAFSEHHQKILEAEHLFHWVWGGHRTVLLIGWRKLKGKRKKYHPRVRRYYWDRYSRGMVAWEDIEAKEGTIYI